MSPENQDSKGVKGDWARALRDASPYLGLGTTIAASLALGLWGGYWLDKRLGTEPWFLLFGSLFGMAAGFYHLYFVVTGKRKQ